MSAGLLVYAVWNVDLARVAARLADTRWGVLAASVALNLLSVGIRGWRWRYLFPPDARPSRLTSAVCIGYMGNNLLPLRAGEFLRIYVVARRGQRFWTTAATVLVERLLDALAVGLMLAVLLLVVPIPAELRWSALLFMSADLAIMALLAVVAAAPQRCRALARVLLGHLGRGERLAQVVDTLIEGLRGISTPGHALPLVLGSAGIWLALALHVRTAFAAAGLDLPGAAAWTVLAFLGLGVSLPSSPGFVGVVQAATVVALSLFAVPREEALSFSLLLHAAQFFPITLLGLALLAVEHMSLGEAMRAGQAPAEPPGR